MNGDIIKVFKKTGALLEGHFILTSGRHSATYFQCARVLQHPRYLSLLGQMIKDHFQEAAVDTVISPALGGIVIGTEVGRQLGVRTVFAERKDGLMTLRRGFDISPGERFLIVEDVITTGGSVREVMDMVVKSGGRVIGVGVVVDRSNGKVTLHDNQFSAIKLKAVSYAENEIPDWLAAIPAVKPGSRQ